MKHCLILLSLVCLGTIEASKTKFTVYNKSEEAILVSIDTMPRIPLGKSSINPRAAKNFLLST